MTDFKDKKPDAPATVAAIIIIAIAIFRKLDPRSFKKQLDKFFSSPFSSKSELIVSFGVDRKTFGKWIVYFVPQKDFPHYKKKRKFTLAERNYLLELLGDPEELGPAMSKKEIATFCESDTKTLRENVLLNPSAYGVTAEIYNNLSKFPPLISQSIIQQYN